MANFIITSSYGETSLWHYSNSLANELASRHHNVIVVVTGQRHDIESPSSNPSVLTWPSTKPKKWKDFVFLHKLIKKQKTDCIIGFVGGINVSMITGWFDRVPSRVAYYQIISKAVERDTELSHLKITCQRSRKRLVYLLTSKIIAVSHACALDVIETYKVLLRKVKVLPILIDDPGMTADLDQREEKVVCVARQDHNKGQDILINAIPAILEKNPDLKILFIGEGPARQDYEALANSLGVSKNTKFTGGLPHSDTLAQMASASALVLPTRDDALPLVIIEALSVGTPVIATRVGGIPEIINDGETGILVTPENSPEMAEKINLVIQSADLRECLSHSGKQLFIDHFSLKNIDQHADYFEVLLN